MRSHLLEKKSAKRKRRFRRAEDVNPSNARSVKKLLGR